MTGFPWNLIIYSLSKNLNFIHIISIIGTYSLNLVIISLFTLPVLYFLKKTKKEIIVCILLLFLPIIFITYGSIQKKEFLKDLEKKNDYTIRVIGSNIKLDRFYNNIQPEKVINELISISSPEKKKNIFFIWPEGIIPNTYRDELNLYSNLFKKYFDKNHLIGLGITTRKTNSTR